VTTPKETEGEEGEEVDRGVGAQTELPSGVPMWPPRVLLARERTYTKSWDKWILKQGGSNRSESGPHVADGYMVSDVILWLDYSLPADKVALAAEDEGDMDTAWALSKIGKAYRNAVYQADCKRVDHVTLDLIIKPVSKMYIRQNRMELETVTVRPNGLGIVKPARHQTCSRELQPRWWRRAWYGPGRNRRHVELAQHTQSVRAMRSTAK
jgi:hypothetical protein